MSKASYTGSVWTMRDSATPLLAVGDQLDFTSQGNSLSITCTSGNPANVQRWGNVGDCIWRQNGGPAGYLTGTVNNDSGESFPFVVTHLAGTPNWIHVEVVAQPAGGVMAMSGGGGGPGGGTGNDEPP